MVIPGASYDYHDDIIKLENKQTASMKISVENSGLYDIYVDYYFLDDSTSDTEGSIMVNGQFQYYEARQIVLKANWLPKTNHFSLDRYGNEIVPSSIKDIKWYRFENHEGVISDGSRLHDGTMKVALNAGENTIDITVNNGSVLLGDVTLAGSANIPTYDEYIQQYQNAPKNSQLITMEPEYITGKNDLAIRLASERDPSCKPNYDTVDKLLNNVYHDSWNKGNQSISWELDVPSDGLYNFAFKYIQYGLIDLPAYRTITIDGVLPYQELDDYAFNYVKSWTNESLNRDDGMLYVYLTKGKHLLTMTVSLEKYRYLIEETNRIMKEMNDMSLQIKGLTNGQSDQYRDWEISKYIPNLKSELLRWADELDNLVTYGNKLSDAKNGSSEFSNLELGAKKLRTLAKDPDQMPNRMGEFTDGDSSVSQYLGNTMLKLYQNPLGLEKIYLTGEGVKLPKTKANLFVRLWEGIKRFFLSFFNKEYGVSKVAPDEIEVWVRRSRQYIEIMQKMVDEAGLKAKFSIMPDENKLVLANASKDLPDVAMGVDNWIPYDLAIRGITVDLRQYDGYEEMVSKMTKGALIPYIYQTGMYGIPETQDFWVLFYRTDITEKLGIAIPETWDDVVGILPQLQRLGLNFYEPLSSYTGLKPFVATLPFLYQYGGSLYSEDGMTTTLSSEANIKALKFMTDLFTIYNVPQEVANFYNYFRYGTLPIGIANSATYLQLLVAAPEIKGNWDLALHPGYEDASGNVYHYATTGSQGIMMFNDSKKQQQSFDFIKWWMSTDVQKEFILNLQSMYGEEYMWFTANNEAFDSLPIPTSHKELIKEQWSWAMEASRIPAAYMVERSISDAFSKIVFNGENTRIALDDAVIDANREIARKMEEFGYMKDGVKIKDYIVPTIYNIDQWLTEEGD
jgi:ABC-type glycerol-3-phosphate transport system substrate-binding protein